MRASRNAARPSRGARMSEYPIQELAALLNGKTVALVGNATALLDCNQGEQIDDHDVVVRMNRGLPVKHAAQGSKFDLWCFSTGAWVRQELRTYPKVPSIWMSPKLRDVYDGSFRCAFYPPPRWKTLRDAIGARPSVGCMVLDLLTGFSPKTVGVFGFDFKRSGTFYEARLNQGPHDFISEENFTRRICDERGWAIVSCDPVQTG